MSRPPDPPQLPTLPHGTTRQQPGTPSATAAPAMPAPGADRSARFRTTGELGRGGMGIVELAEDVALGREVAVKRLLLGGDPDTVARFVEEAQVTGQLEHPNIVPVHELGIDPDGRPWLAMKRVQGRTLLALIEAQRAAPRLTPEHTAELLDVMDKVCAAVAFAHARGVVHRDLKPENVMLGDFGEVLVMDWGLARPLGQLDAIAVAALTGDPSGNAAALRPVDSDRRADAGARTVEGSVFGTPGYMAPEQARGETDRLGPLVDVFGLGATLYHLLTLQMPYSGGAVLKVLAKAGERRLRTPRLRAPGRRIPRALESIVLRAMAAEPAERYPSVQALADDLRALRDHGRVRAHRERPAERAQRAIRRHPTASAAAALSVVFTVLLALGVALWVARDRGQRQRLAEEGRVAAEAREAAREAELRALAQTGKAERLRDALGVEVRLDRERALHQFGLEWAAAQRRNEPTYVFFARFPTAHLEWWLGAYKRLFDRHRMVGREVEDLDLFYYALLLHRVGKDLDGARAMFERAVVQLPDKPSVHSHYAMLLLDLRRDREAAKRIARAVQLRPTDAGYLALSARIKQRLGDLPGALAELDRAITLVPEAAMLWRFRGALRLRAERFREALADYDRALQLEPDHLDALAARGGVLVKFRRWADVRRDLDPVVRKQPANALAWHHRGVARTELGDPLGGYADADHAVLLAPADWRSWIGRAIALARLGRREAALADYARGFELAPADARVRIEASRKRELKR